MAQMLVRNLGVRFTSSDRKLIYRVCRARREGVSDFVRRAVAKELALLGYLTPEETRALGVSDAPVHRKTMEAQGDGSLSPAAPAQPASTENKLREADNNG